MATMRRPPLKWGIFIFLVSCKVAATCPADGVGPLTFNLPPLLVVTPDVSVGTVLAEVEQTAISTIDSTCEGLQIQGLPGNLVADGIYSTNLKGIGYRIWQGETLLTGDERPILQAQERKPLRIQLVKTASGVTGIGTLTGGTYGSLMAANGTTIALNMSPVFVSATTCTLTTPDIYVTLNIINSNHFTAVGKTGGDTPFAIAMTCDDSTRVAITLTGTSATDLADQGVLAPQTGTTTGIGIQVLFDNQPIPLGEELVLPDLPSGAVSLPFQARYYQTTDSISAGWLTATASFVFTYQ